MPMTTPNTTSHHLKVEFQERYKNEQISLIVSSNHSEERGAEVLESR